MLELFVFLMQFPWPEPKHANQKPDAVSYRRLIWTARTIASLGLLLGIGMWIAFAMEASAGDKTPEFRSGKQVLVFVLAPILFAALGYFGGTTMGLTFASNQLYASPLGTDLLALVGSRRPFIARVVCFLLSTVVLGLPTWLVGFLVMKEYEEKWSRKGGWLYSAPSLASSVTVSPSFEVDTEPLPPDPIAESEQFCENVRYQLKDNEHAEMTHPDESPLLKLFVSIDQERLKWSDAPEAQEKIDVLEQEIAKDRWYRLAKSMLLHADEVCGMLKDPTALNSLDMLRQSEIQAAESSIVIPQESRRAFVIVTKSVGGLSLSREWNQLLKDRVAESFENVENFVVVQKASQVIGLYKSDQPIQNVLNVPLEEELKKQPDGKFEDQGLRQMLYMRGAFRWMYHVQVVSPKEPSKRQSFVVYMDDSDQQQSTVSSSVPFGGFVNHNDQRCAAKFKEFIEQLTSAVN